MKEWSGLKRQDSGCSFTDAERQLLASNKKVSVTQKNDRFFIRNLPKKAPDGIDTVIMLKLVKEC